MDRTEKYKDTLEKHQAKLKRFKISYFYLASGMDGHPDIFPEKIIEAKTKDMAAFIYYMMFFAETDPKNFENLKYNFAFKSFQSFMTQSETHRFWGLQIEEV
jgi:hypothetical protein